MKRKISLQSKSFGILFLLAVIGTFGCILYSKNHTLTNQFYNSNDSQPDYQVVTYPDGQYSHAPTPTGTGAPTPTPDNKVDTSKWKVFTDTKNNITFSYAPTWKVHKAVKKDGYDVIVVDPGVKYDNIKIYISPTNYFAMEHLPTLQERLGKNSVTNVGGLLYGIKSSNLYYTFDIGASLTLKPLFQTMVESVSFGN